MSARAFFSSRTFHWMKSMISGWSMSRQTIFAARRVVPPDFVAPAARSSTSRKLMSPELVPPPESFSCLPRIDEKFVADRLDEARRALRALVRVRRLAHRREAGRRLTALVLDRVHADGVVPAG